MGFSLNRGLNGLIDFTDFTSDVPLEGDWGWNQCGQMHFHGI